MYVYIFVYSKNENMETECFTWEDLEKLAYVLKAVAHPNRLKIICLLSKNGEMSVSDICDRMGCSQALISHHLTDMQAKGILLIRREGRNAFYSMASDHVTEAMRCMMKCTK
jgi:transcriptional regulator, arsR family